MSSSNTTCIFSTLKFISEHSRHHKVTPIITFDQPLWWNALMVIESEPADSDLRQVVLRLGSFHTEMSFIGSIGHLIAESGLKELLELIYVPNAVAFDGHTRHIHKDTTQERRTGGKGGATVTFTDDMKLTVKKNHFQANKTINSPSLICLVVIVSRPIAKSTTRQLMLICS